jgi:membrane-bound ClpP family serine protease
MDSQERYEGQAKLDQAYDQLEDLAPDRLARAIRWLRDPKGRMIRLPLGIVIAVVSLIGPIVPVLGIEFLPLGLLLIAQDVPPLRKPVAEMTLWLEYQWVRLRSRWRRRHKHS